MKRYGKNKLSYLVVEKMNGRIELQVHHENKAVRKLLRRQSGNLHCLLEHVETYRKDHARAYYWLSQVIDDYRMDFAANQVDITFH